MVGDEVCAHIAGLEARVGGEAHQEVHIGAQANDLWEGQVTAIITTSFSFMGQRSINECYGSISYLSTLPSNDCFPFFSCIKVLQMKSRNSQIRKKHPVNVLRNHHILPFVFFLIPKHDKDTQQREHTKTSHPLWSHTVLRRKRQVSDSNNQGDNCAH